MCVCIPVVDRDEILAGAGAGIGRIWPGPGFLDFIFLWPGSGRD